MGTAPVQILPPGIWLFGRCAEYILSSYRQEGLGSFHFSYFCLLATPTSRKLRRGERKKRKRTLSHSFFTLLGLVKGKCSPGWSAARQRTQEGSVAAHRQPHHMPSTQGWIFPHLVLLNRPPLLTTGWWQLHSLGPAWGWNLPSPALSSILHHFTQLDWRTGMPLHSISWGTSRAGSKPGQGDYVLYKHAMLEVLALLSHIYLFLKNLRAGKALDFILALSLVRSLTFRLQAELATWLVYAVPGQEQFPLWPHPHHHSPPWGFSQVLWSHSLSYEVVLHLHPFATIAQLVFLRRPFWKISLPVSQICGICSSENNFLTNKLWHLLRALFSPIIIR